jgi:predicted nucleic acid-binding Zn ribbon protein
MIITGRMRVGEVIAEMPGEQHGHQVSGRHRRCRVARVRGGAGPDRVNPQLLAQVLQPAG